MDDERRCSREDAERIANAPDGSIVGVWRGRTVILSDVDNPGSWFMSSVDEVIDPMPDCIVEAPNGH